MIDHCFCYCLYGRDLNYYEPIKLVAEKLSSNPRAVIFLGTTHVDLNFVYNYYQKYKNIKVYCIDNDYKFRERLIRFLAPKYVEAKYYHYRDADSIITDFELSLISIYLTFKFPILILRNHPLHFSPIMAGMFSLNHEFGKKLVSLVEDQLHSIEPKDYYDQIFLTNTLYEKYKSEAVVFSSHICYDGEIVHKIMFDKYNFVGKPMFWGLKDCEHACNESLPLFSNTLVKLPFFLALSFLYQRGRFVKLLILASKLKI